MKSVALPLLLLLLFGGCKKDEEPITAPIAVPGAGNPQVPVTGQKRSLLIKFSGTLCDPCGEWGWQLMDTMMAFGKDSAAFITAYSQNFVSEGFISNTATGMDRNWKVNVLFGYPTFWLNGAVIQGQNEVEVKNKLKQKMMEFGTSAKPEAGVAFTKEVSGDMLRIKASVQFTKSVFGAYYLATYLTEDSAMWRQEGHPISNGMIAIPHHQVLRNEVSGADWYGSFLFDGQINTGVFYDRSYSLKIPADWNHKKLFVTTVVWKKTTSGWEYVNAATDQH